MKTFWLWLLMPLIVLSVVLALLYYLVTKSETGIDLVYDIFAGLLD